MGKVANVGFRTTDGQVYSVHFFKQASTVNLTGDCGNKCLFPQGDSEFRIYLLNHFTATARGANYFRSAVGPSPMRDRPPHRGLRRLLFTNGG